MSATTTNASPPAAARRLLWCTVVVAAGAILGCGGSTGLETGDPLITNTEPTPAESWRRDVGRAVELGPMALEGDWVLAPTEGPLQRIRGADGAELWKRKLPSGAASDPVLCAGTLVVVTDVPSGRVMGIDPASGEVRWEWERSVGYLAAADSVLIFSGRGGRILRFDPAAGKVIWETRRPGSGWRAPAIDRTRELVFIPMRPDSVIALDYQGREIWARQAGGWPRLSAGDSLLVIATDDSLLLAWDPATGDERSRLKLPALAAARPVMEGSTLFLALRDGRVWCLVAGSWDEIWSQRFEPPLLSAPTRGGALLYQAGTRGRIYVLDASTGLLVETLQHPESLIAPPGSGVAGVAAGGDEGTLVSYRRVP